MWVESVSKKNYTYVDMLLVNDLIFSIVKELLEIRVRIAKGFAAKILK